MKKFLLITVSLLFAGFMFAQDCSDLFISEYVEGSGNNKAIEIYNPTDGNIDLSEYRLVRYSNGGTTPHYVDLAGTIASKETYVVVIDKRDPSGTGYEEPAAEELQAKADTFLCPVYEVNKMMYFNGNDAVTLEKTGGVAIVDIVARVGSPDSEDGWTNITDTTITWSSGGVPTEYTIVNYMVGPLFWLSWTQDNTMIRKSSVKEGIKENPAVFMVQMEWDTLPENTFSSLGTHQCDCDDSSVNEMVEGVDINFFPNPFTGNVLNITAIEKITSVTVYNVAGQAILNETFTGLMQTSLRTNEFIGGVYFVRVGFADQTSFVKKIIKQ